MYRKYMAAEKVMPYNAKKLVTNIHPKVTFNKDEVIITEQYFHNGEVKERLLVKNLTTSKITKRAKKKAEDKMPFDEHRTIPVKSFDQKWSISSLDYNIILKDEKKNVEYQLTEDGCDEYVYGMDDHRRAFEIFKQENHRTSCVWSKDSQKAIVNILVAKNIGTLTVTQVYNHESKTEPMHPRDFVYHDYFPFEECTEQYQLGIIDVKTKTLKVMNKAPFHIEGWGDRIVKWNDDSTGFYFVEMDPYYSHKMIYYVSLEDLNPVLMGEEKTDTFFQDNTMYGPLYAKFPTGVHILKGDQKGIWLSKKVDLGDLYIYDFTKKEFTFKITSDDYNVSNLLAVDEENEIIYFIANSLSIMSDPYYGALCSIKFDGSDFKILTKEDAVHYISINVEQGVYVDTYSRVDTAPITVLGKLDGSESEVLLKANISKLLKAGYILPKRTKITLDDGMTLYGVIILPHNYDENKKYPVVEHCYGGPQTINTPKSFTAWGDIPGREAYGGLEAFAQLGFIGVVIDGRGTPDRGKKMHDYSYKNLHGLDGLCDHEPFLRKLALEYKGIDLDRVGIWGNSAGGYMSTRALLEYPDFYKVAVSSAGDHDNQIYNQTWAFRYHGPFEKDVYLAQDSAQLVDNLKGHLLLCHGLLDDNVHPSQTFRMIQYFNDANKTVDLMLLPDTDHNCPGNVYFMKRRFDYFVTHLMGKKPPLDFKFSGQN